MSHKYAGGCDHIHTHSDNDPIDNHTCHCSVCKRVTGQDTTHVVFFGHTDLNVDNLEVTRAKQSVDSAEIQLLESRINLILTMARYNAMLPTQTDNAE